MLWKNLHKKIKLSVFQLIKTKQAIEEKPQIRLRLQFTLEFKSKIYLKQIKVETRIKYQIHKSLCF